MTERIFAESDLQDLLLFSDFHFFTKSGRDENRSAAISYLHDNKSILGANERERPHE